MKKVTVLCLSLLSASASLADVRLMMDVCVDDRCMKGEFVLDETNPVAQITDDAGQLVVQVQQVEATEQDASDEKQSDESSTEVVPAPEFEVTIQNNGETTTHMVQGQWGCAMHCNTEMVMVTMMAHQ